MGQPSEKPTAGKNDARGAAALLLELGYEGLEVFAGDVGDGPEGHAAARPVKDVVARARLRGRWRVSAGRRPYEHINVMEAPLVYEGGDGTAVGVIEPATHERESRRGQVHDRRREIEFAVKPRLHCVLIGGYDVG